MISTLLALLLGPAQIDAVNRARTDYSRCVTTQMKTSLKERADEAGFQASLAAACGGKAQVLRSASIAADTSMGIKRADAEEGAQMELDDILLNAKENFVAHKEGNTYPE